MCSFCRKRTALHIQSLRLSQSQSLVHSIPTRSRLLLEHTTSVRLRQSRLLLVQYWRCRYGSLLIVTYHTRYTQAILCLTQCTWTWIPWRVCFRLSNNKSGEKHSMKWKVFWGWPCSIWCMNQCTLTLDLSGMCCFIVFLFPFRRWRSQLPRIGWPWTKIEERSQ